MGSFVARMGGRRLCRLVMMQKLKKMPFFLPFGGCHGRCVYCHQQTITGVSELPSPQYVSSVLSALTEPREVCFFGGSFCRFDYATVRSYLDAAANCAPKGSRIRFSTYPGDLRDDKLRSLVLSYPIACVELGIPSLDKKVLASCKREADPRAILDDIRLLRDESVNLAVQMMIGLPGQSMESSLLDLETVADIKGPLDWELRLYPCLVIEGTELCSMLCSGSYNPLSVEEAAVWGGIFMDKALELGFRPIRAGLQESALLASQVRGGPHHPALGELIFSEAYARKLVRLSPKGPWTLPASEMSKFTGHGKFGIRLLAEKSGLLPEEVEKRLSFF